MGTTSDATRATHPERPGLHDGVCGEFTVFVPIKPGQTQALRDTLRHYRTDPSAQKAMREAFDQIGTVHTARYVIFDNDTRLMFASVFDGDWDTYIDDFATTMIVDDPGQCRVRNANGARTATRGASRSSRRPWTAETPPGPRPPARPSRAADG